MHIQPTSYFLQYHGKKFRVVEWKRHNAPSNLTLCLHGFGRVPEDFHRLTQEIEENERMVAIGLFSHEENYAFSESEKEKGLSIASWLGQVEFILNHYQVNQCKLIAYSMGGRLGLTALQHCPHYFREAHFLATDGLIRNKLYRFTVGTTLGRAVAVRIKNNASLLIHTASLLHRMGLLNKKLLRFVTFYMQEKSMREQVFDVWMGYRHCYPSIRELAHQLEIHAIPTSFTFGVYDAIIPWKHGRRLRKLTQQLPFVTWHQVEKGHRLLD